MPRHRHYLLWRALCERAANQLQPDEHAPERPPSAYVIFSNREWQIKNKITIAPLTV
jgi:hypothetical protein